MEMTGLNPGTDRIIEIALVITDAQLNTLAEAPVLVVHQPDDILDGMDKWNQSTHGKSGLIDKVKTSTLSETEVESRMLAFLELHVPAVLHPCVVIPSVRTGVSWRDPCPNWKAIFITAISMSAHSKNWQSAGSLKSPRDSINRASTKLWPISTIQ